METYNGNEFAENTWSAQQEQSNELNNAEYSMSWNIFIWWFVNYSKQKKRIGRIRNTLLVAAFCFSDVNVAHAIIIGFWFAISRFRWLIWIFAAAVKCERREIGSEWERARERKG